MLLYYLSLIETEEERQLFARLYELHKKQMHYVANQVLRNDTMSEDAVHNAFEGVARNMKSLEGKTEEDMKNYLLKASQNAALNLSKRERKQEDYYVHLDSEAADDDVLEELCAKLDRETVVHAILQIKEPYSAVLYCHFVMDMDDKQMADTFHRKPATVRQQLSRGREKLKKLLKEALNAYG